MVLINTDLKIKEFLGFFRKTFPDVSITPKLHLLEDHVVKFLQLWRVGFGMLGEQGAESIHTVYNQLNRVYANIHSGEDRLRQVTIEHHRKSCPLLQLNSASVSEE
jgi:hypothetical protein